MATVRTLGFDRRIESAIYGRSWFCGRMASYGTTGFSTFAKIFLANASVFSAPRSETVFLVGQNPIPSSALTATDRATIFVSSPAVLAILKANAANRTDFFNP